MKLIPQVPDAKEASCSHNEFELVDPIQKPSMGVQRRAIHASTG
jgi:hypothetical protein